MKSIEVMGSFEVGEGTPFDSLEFQIGECLLYLVSSRLGYTSNRFLCMGTPLAPPPAISMGLLPPAQAPHAPRKPTPIASRPWNAYPYP